MTKEQLHDAKMMAEQIMWTRSIKDPITKKENDALRTLLGDKRYYEIIDHKTRQITEEEAVNVIRSIDTLSDKQ